MNEPTNDPRPRAIVEQLQSAFEKELEPYLRPMRENYLRATRLVRITLETVLGTRKKGDLVGNQELKDIHNWADDVIRAAVVFNHASL